MTRWRTTERESIRREAAGLRDAGLALEALAWSEKRRVLVALCDRFCIDSTTLGTINRDGTSQRR